MALKLKPIGEQVVVITGASSGIGLATALEAARRGARVVLAARNEDALRDVAQRIRGAGGEAVYVPADVARMEDVQRIVQSALDAYGGFDTWVNNAGISVYGHLEEQPLEDARRLFDTNYWGTVHGSLAALPHLRRRGGAIINVGSVVSDIAIPLQGHYSASKHAVKGFTDSLRYDVEREGAPISVTLVKPSAVDTPYIAHARNLMSVEPDLPPPVYDPEVVARTILDCAQHPRRDVTVGGGGKMLAMMGTFAPRLADLYAERALYGQQRKTSRPSMDRRDALYQPSRPAGMVRGTYDGHVSGSSVFTQSVLHRDRAVLAIGAAAALGAAVAVGSRLLRGRADDFERDPDLLDWHPPEDADDEVRARPADLEPRSDDYPVRGIRERVPPELIGPEV